MEKSKVRKSQLFQSWKRTSHSKSLWVLLVSFYLNIARLFWERIFVIIFYALFFNSHSKIVALQTWNLVRESVYKNGQKSAVLVMDIFCIISAQLKRHFNRTNFYQVINSRHSQKAVFMNNFLGTFRYGGKMRTLIQNLEHRVYFILVGSNTN